MSPIQRFLTAILPHTWAEAMQAESRAWMLQCSCGHERSVWAAGGVRWKATGNPRWRLVCPRCGQRTWHTLSRRS
jgi:hypothetical protein